MTRRLAHELFGHRPTVLLVRVRRYRCAGCGRFWRQNTTVAAAPKARVSRGAIRWALEASIVLDHLTVSRVAANLGVSWHTGSSQLRG